MLFCVYFQRERKEVFCCFFLRFFHFFFLSFALSVGSPFAHNCLSLTVTVKTSSLSSSGVGSGSDKARGISKPRNTSKSSISVVLLSPFIIIIIIMREPLTKTKKKEALRATLEKDDARPEEFSVKERIETAMMEVLGKRGLEKTC